MTTPKDQHGLLKSMRDKTISYYTACVFTHSEDPLADCYEAAVDCDVAALSSDIIPNVENETVPINSEEKSPLSAEIDLNDETPKITDVLGRGGGGHYFLVLIV